MAERASELHQHLMGLHANASQSIASATSDQGPAIGRLLQLDNDILAWERALSGRPETQQLGAARRELGFAIYCCSSGLYVQAFAGLRLFLELSFAAVYFSANELHRRRWVSDRADFSWSKALAPDEGVLSSSFVREFDPEAGADAKTFADEAAECYRHCSQFIHGKLAVTQALPDRLEYSEAALTDWVSYAQKAAKCVLYLLYARFGKELEAGSDDRLSATIEHAFSHLKHVRKALGLPTEVDI